MAADQGPSGSDAAVAPILHVGRSKSKRLGIPCSAGASSCSAGPPYAPSALRRTTGKHFENRGYRRAPSAGHHIKDPEPQSTVARGHFTKGAATCLENWAESRHFGH